MRALVAAPEEAARVRLVEVGPPEPLRDEAVVAVRAVSLNRGELRRLETAAPGWRPGWDVAGEVRRAARDGSGPPVGARVVGLLHEGAWAEEVAVPTRNLAELPEGITLAQAATLPVAGLTALRALALGGLLLGRRVLVTGASGGVGRFAVQLAARAGAEVVAVASSAERAAGLEALGAREVVRELAAEGAPLDVVLESVGGASLAAALTRVAPGGLVVSFGNSSRAETRFDPFAFYGKNGARLRGFLLFDELVRTGSGARDLRLLAERVASGALDPQLALEASWRDPRPAFDALLGRRLNGKAVLHFD